MQTVVSSPGAKLGTPTPSSSPSSCSSRLRLQPLSLIIMSGSAASRISPPWPGLRKMTSSTRGKVSAITRELAICMRLRKPCNIAMEADFHAISRQSVHCPVSGVTRPMPSRPSPLISQFPLSKPTLLAFWRACLIFTARSIEPLAGKSSGSAPARWFQNIPPAFTIRRLSISAR